MALTGGKCTVQPGGPPPNLIPDDAASKNRLEVHDVTDKETGPYRR